MCDLIIKSFPDFYNQIFDIQDEFNTDENLAPGDRYFKVYSNSYHTGYDLDLNLCLDDAGNNFSQTQSLGSVLEDKQFVG